MFGLMNRPIYKQQNFKPKQKDNLFIGNILNHKHFYIIKPKARLK